MIERLRLVESETGEKGMAVVAANREVAVRLVEGGRGNVPDLVDCDVVEFVAFYLVCIL